MARRKEDKLRPYRVDYFLVDEMKDYDKALIHSTVVRAITSDGAASQMGGGTNVVIIRAYRYYKKLGTRKQNVYKAVEDIFSPNKAVKVMEQVEARREVNAQFAPVDSTMDNNGHQTRFSDSSLYDEVCVNCGATDTSGKLDHPCPSAPASGPSSPATQAVVADLAGMTAHDAHEQVMDTFVPTPGQPDISKFDLDAAAPVVHPAPEDLPYTDPNHVCTDKCIEFVAINDPMPGTPTFIQPPCDRVLGGDPMPLALKLVLFGSISLIAIVIVLALLHCGK